MADNIFEKMTEEEAIKIIEVGKNFAFDEKYIEAFDIAIKALKQESILDRVMAEIDKISEQEGHSFDCLDVLDDLKEFINKYKAESEG